MLITLGSLGVGLVWGWLIAGASHSVRKPIRNVLLLSIATSFISAEVIWLAGWRAFPSLLGAAGGAFLAHLAWRRRLSERVGKSDY